MATKGQQMKVEEAKTNYSDMIELDNSQKEGYCKKVTNERT